MRRSYIIYLSISVGLLFVGFSRVPEYHYVLAEYDLSPCPPANYELPERVYEPDFKLEGNGWRQYCHGFTGYELETSKPELRMGTQVPDVYGNVYARLIPGHACRLQVVAEVVCFGEGTDRKDKCFEWHDGNRPAPIEADLFAKNIFHSLKYKAQAPASKVSFLGDKMEFVKHCVEMAGK